ncbi:hypothetical protein BTM25_28920 [Actinomadura rubteroloni]|uniref:Uncharacterized protein n=1 Tax=Actinomadura rubteroloni TaxID=1926885 RepID=A0A2P4UGR8_9ACTN|nr:hypothetical protein [Actinomadura rubteroloni]POM24264.1 hypothetical protein BTM25_28920 [Actinomadura rubteroloni]
MRKKHVAALLLGFLPLFAGAGTATAATANDQSGRYCVMVVGKAAPGKASPVLSHKCADDMATATRRAGMTESAASDTLLMEWFWNANNNPPKLTRVLGKYGPCDAQGYVINVYDDWTNQISGFNSYNDCNHVAGYDLSLQQGDYDIWEQHNPCGCTLQGWVGSFMNDRIESFRIRAT